MIAQKEIAKALGVSAVTVSRALRNHPDLSPETRERIIQKARELGYPYQKSKVGARVVKRLGVLLYEKDLERDRQYWTSAAEIPRRILAGIQFGARANHVEAVHEAPLTEEELPFMIQNRTVEGVLLLGRYGESALRHLKQIPAISVSNYINNDWLPRVVAANFRGMLQATEYMISQGHRDILFVGGAEGSPTELHSERERGYRQAMISHELKPQVLHCPGCSIAPFHDFLLKQTAIVASYDAFVYGLRNLFLSHGKVLPRDCSMVGFDGNFSNAEQNITSYEPDWDLMGRMAVDLLVRGLDTLPASGVEVVIPGRLVVRGSVARV